MKHLTPSVLLLVVLSLLASGASATDQYIGTWASTTDPANRIEITRIDGAYRVAGREAVVYVGKPPEYHPKTYRAALQPDGALRIAFFFPQSFTIDPHTGNLKSAKSEYRRAPSTP